MMSKLINSHSFIQQTSDGETRSREGTFKLEEVDSWSLGIKLVEIKREQPEHVGDNI